MPHIQRFTEELQLRGLSDNTIDAYVRAVKYLERFCHKSPLEINDEELRTFLLYFRNERGLSLQSFNVNCAALRCFYAALQPERTLHIRTVRPPLILPEVLSPIDRDK